MAPFLTTTSSNAAASVRLLRRHSRGILFAGIRSFKGSLWRTFSKTKTKHDNFKIQSVSEQLAVLWRLHMIPTAIDLHSCTTSLPAHPLISFFTTEFVRRIESFFSFSGCCLLGAHKAALPVPCPNFRPRTVIQRLRYTKQTRSKPTSNTQPFCKPTPIEI